MHYISFIVVLGTAAVTGCCGWCRLCMWWECHCR